jgi:hypothetical protein
MTPRNTAKAKTNMKRLLSPRFLNLATCLGAFVCAAGMLTARADTLITFSVDMATNIANSTFLPGTDTLSVHGTFNSWGAGVTLHQQGSGTVFTNSVDDTGDANGGMAGYKFVDSNSGVGNGGYETLASGYNRWAKLPTNSGALIAPPTPYFSDAGPLVTNEVTFQVDVSQQIQLGNFIPGTSYIVVRGLFNGWAGDSVTLTNDLNIVRTNEYGLMTTNVWDGTFPITNSPAGIEEYKFVITGGASDIWDQPSAANSDGSSGNRAFADVAQTLPLVDFSDSPFAPLASMTFSVDMSVVALTDTNYNAENVTVWGSFNGWGGGLTLTNNPAAANTNIYTSTSVTVGVGEQVQYQFRYSELTSGATVYDHLNGASGGSGNRIYTVPNVTATNLPAVVFNDASLSDYLVQPTAVLFTVDMTGAVGTDTHVFNPTLDSVYINGQFANWYAWAGGANPAPAPAGYQMIEEGTTTIYTNTLLLAAGTPAAFAYKYGMDAGNANGGPSDDEAASGLNHFRVVRATALHPYVMPTDTFGNQYNEPNFTATSTAGGELTIGAASAGRVPVQWLGHSGVRLQVNSTLTGVWQTLAVTDGTNWVSGFNSTNGFVSQTNWPVLGTDFFRLIEQ